MHRFSVLRKSLRDQKWQIAGFGVSLAAIAVMDLFIWPAYRDQLQNFEMPAALEGFLGGLSISTPEGFLTSEYFSWVPILLIVYAVIQGTGAIAGEESAGTMDLLLAQPVSRRLMVTGGNVTGITDQLVKEGLVTRSSLPNDRRAFLVKLTPTGKKAFHRMAHEHEQWVIGLVSYLSPHDRRQLHALLGKLKTGLTKE